MASADFASIDTPDHLKPYPVPLKLATPENAEAFGHIIHDFDEAEVSITTWPHKGWRPIAEGTGIEGGITSGRFICKWVGDLATATSEAVKRDYVIGRLPKDVLPDNRTHVLTRVANYHPDGGQVFFPCEGKAFILVLAHPTDDVKPEDFVALYFDGSFGINLNADVWHQGLYCVEDEAIFLTKQGKVHACVIVDTLNEFGKFLKVPIKPELVQE